MTREDRRGVRYGRSRGGRGRRTEGLRRGSKLVAPDGCEGFGGAFSVYDGGGSAGGTLSEELLKRPLFSDVEESAILQKRRIREAQRKNVG